MYKSLANMWKKPKEGLGEVYKKHIIRWRDESTVVRVEKPTRLDRAKSLGYKAKQGVAVVRVKVERGGRKTPKTAGGRRPTRAGRFFTLNKSKQQTAEERASRKYKNMEVVNSYWVGEDGSHSWYEIILADTSHPAIKKDMNLRVLSSGKQKGRANRGLTSSGKKSRGLRHRGKKK